MITDVLAASFELRVASYELGPSRSRSLRSTPDRCKLVKDREDETSQLNRLVAVFAQSSKLVAHS